MRVLPPLVLVASMFAAGLALADAYEDGFAAYANRNYAAASRFWAPIAGDGNVRAQNSMGILYQNGQGVPRDEAIAFKWYLRAALNGSTDAQYNIGLMYESGRGVERDLVRAHRWFDLSATAGEGGMTRNPIDAITARNRVAAKMPADQVAVAQQKAKQCRDSKFWERD